jgi:hypothetical protein
VQPRETIQEDVRDRETVTSTSTATSGVNDYVNVANVDHYVNVDDYSVCARAEQF